MAEALGQRDPPWQACRMAASIHTLQFASRLRDTGVERDQAEAHAEAMADALSQGQGDLATKADVATLEGHLIKWMVGDGVAVVGVLFALFRLLPSAATGG